MRFGLAVIWVLATLPMYADEKPIVVSTCDLVQHPTNYNRKLVQVHAPIDLAFENFSFRQPDCAPREPGVWLVFGGDVPTPTTSTVNDTQRRPGYSLTIEKLKIPLVRDEAYRRFHSRLTAKILTRPDGSPCHDCYLYNVTAEVVGRFFAGNPTPGGQVPIPGYGHLGCCRLLAIQQIISFTARRTDAGPKGDFDCSDQTWTWKEDRPAARQLQKSVNEGHQPWRMDDVATIAEQALQDRMKEWNETKTGTLRFAELEESPIFWQQSATWTSDDLLTNYSVKLRKPEWLRKSAGKWEWVIWLPYVVHRHRCEPTAE